MLLQEFDSNKNAIINPNDFFKKVDGMPKTCISFFSKNMLEAFLENFEYEVIAKANNSTLEYPIYKIKANDTELAVYQSPVGAPACVSIFEQVAAFGVEQLLLCGCVGCLIPEIKDYGIILPTAALRDEGTSFHYKPESDEIEIDPSLISIIEDHLKENHISYFKGKTWTTDAIFRETKDKTETRKKQGAIVVDMECSAMAAVCEFRNIKFVQMFYGADTLAFDSYDIRSLVSTNTNEETQNKLKILKLAIDCACKLDKK